MPTDYDRIREDNIREYGQGSRHLFFLGRLYTDRTHFVFELLQNAEDAGATRILFRLFDDRLEVTHDGRAFNEADVRGVCGVGEGTKAEDLTQIGKFGIGFKSVYAYTKTPEIHSGGEGFRIENYVRPYAVSLKPAGHSWTTLFVFPFNTDEICPEIACKEIAGRLRNLCARTLLFLRRVGEIEYNLPDSKGGLYLREEVARGPGRQVSVIGQNNGKEEEESWLIFERAVPVQGKSETVPVEVSFRLEAEDKAGKNPERLTKVKDSPLVVYFPTEKATRFGFLIQGPYRTTPSRDNIPKDDEWNEFLVMETAEFVGEILPKIKDLGLLSVSFLETLPIRTADFPEDSMFYPIAKSVRDALAEQNLLPCDDGSFVSAKKAKLARGGELRKLLNQDQLSLLFQSSGTVKWLVGDITQDRTPDLRSYLISALDVEEVTPDGFARKIDHLFLSGQSDDWFFDFYKYLSGQEALWRAPRWEHDSSGILRSKPILRLENGNQEVPFRPDSITPNAFLPPPEETTFPIVRRSFMDSEQSQTFLERLGLSQPDVFDDIVEKVLPKYTKVDGASVSDFDHKADMHKIIRAMRSDSEAGKSKVIKMAKQTPFLKATNSSGVTTFKKSVEIYVNTPDLRRYFSNSRTVWFLHDDYSPAKIDIDFFLALDVSDLPRKLQISEGLPDEQREHSNHEEIIKNHDLDGLENFLRTIHEISDFEEQLNSATVLWNFLRNHLEQDSRFLKARYDWFYYRWRSKDFNSKILVRLKGSKWIPTKDGALKKPGEVTTDQLLDEFLSASELIDSLGIAESTNQNEDEGKSERQRREREVAKTLGIEDHNTLERAKQFVLMPPEEQERVLTNFEEQQKFEPPKYEPSNPDRRAQRVGAMAAEAPSRKTEVRNRSVAVGLDTIKEEAGQYLQQYYVIDGNIICQVCRGPMPFKLDDGSSYFEKVEFLSELKKRHHQNYLALCPNHAAMFQYTNGSRDQLKGMVIQARTNELEIILAQHPTQVYFTKTHLFDLRALIQAEDGHDNGKAETETTNEPPPSPHLDPSSLA